MSAPKFSHGWVPLNQAAKSQQAAYQQKQAAAGQDAKSARAAQASTDANAKAGAKTAAQQHATDVVKQSDAELAKEAAAGDKVAAREIARRKTAVNKTTAAAKKAAALVKKNTKAKAGAAAKATATGAAKQAAALNQQFHKNSGVQLTAEEDLIIDLAESSGDAELIDLAGKWRHNWIPLDAVAAAVKAKRYHGGTITPDRATPRSSRGKERFGEHFGDRSKKGPARLPDRAKASRGLAGPKGAPEASPLEHVGQITPRDAVRAKRSELDQHAAAGSTVAKQEIARREARRAAAGGQVGGRKEGVPFSPKAPEKLPADEPLPKVEKNAGYGPPEPSPKGQPVKSESTLRVLPADVTPETVTGKQLAPHIANYGTPAVAKAAGFDYEHGRRPVVGELGVSHTRGSHRQGVVTKVTPTKATLSYVTEGGVKEGERIIANHHEAKVNVESRVKATEAQARKNHKFHTDQVAYADGKMTPEAYKAKYGYLPYKSDADSLDRKVAAMNIDDHAKAEGQRIRDSIMKPYSTDPHDYATVTHRQVHIKDLGLKSAPKAEAAPAATRVDPDAPGGVAVATSRKVDAPAVKSGGIPVVHKDHPNNLGKLDALPHTMIPAGDLKPGHLLVDPELHTPVHSIDHKGKTVRNSGQVSYHTFNHETGKYDEIHLNPKTMVPVHATAGKHSAADIAKAREAFNARKGLAETNAKLDVISKGQAALKVPEGERTAQHKADIAAAWDQVAAGKRAKIAAGENPSPSVHSSTVFSEHAPAGYKSTELAGTSGRARLVESASGTPIGATQQTRRVQRNAAGTGWEPGDGHHEALFGGNAIPGHFASHHDAAKALVAHHAAELDKTEKATTLSLNRGTRLAQGTPWTAVKPGHNGTAAGMAAARKTKQSFELNGHTINVEHTLTEEQTKQLLTSTHAVLSKAAPHIGDRKVNVYVPTGDKTFRHQKGKGDVLAYVARATRGEQNNTIHLSPTAAEGGGMLDAQMGSKEGGQFMPSAYSAGAQKHTIAHELGHLVDIWNTDTHAKGEGHMGASDNARSARALKDEQAAGLSFYGRSSAAEAYAEAFAEHLHGDGSNAAARKYATNYGWKAPK